MVFVCVRRGGGGVGRGTAGGQVGGSVVRDEAGLDERSQCRAGLDAERTEEEIRVLGNERGDDDDDDNDERYEWRERQTQRVSTCKKA